jgi:chromosome partitioning protein
MSTIAILGNKGGTGKTTLSVNIASGLSKSGNVVLIDADPQRSSLQWSQIREDDQGLPVIDGVENLDDVIEQVNGKYDHIVIDCPPSIHTEQSSQALSISDTALVPVQPSPYDLWATVHLEEYLHEARKSNPHLSAVMVVNQVEPRTRFSRFVYQALSEIDMLAAETPIYRRVAYKYSVLEGRSVHDMGSRGKAASKEIFELIDEVIKV